MFLKFCLSYRVIAVSCLLLISYGCTGLTGTTIKNENISKLPSDVDDINQVNKLLIILEN
jgi:hypothetical protein